MKAQTRALLEWVVQEPRAYSDTIGAWRTTCPHHAVWEDALDEGLVEVVRGEDVARVVVTSRGRALIEER